MLKVLLRVRRFEQAVMPCYDIWNFTWYYWYRRAWKHNYY